MLSMPRRKKSEHPVSHLLPPEEPIDDQPIEGRVFKRPDGYYWERKAGSARPVRHAREAEADLLAGGTTLDFDPEDSLQEAESELGISELDRSRHWRPGGGQHPPPRGPLALSCIRGSVFRATSAKSG